MAIGGYIVDISYKRASGASGRWYVKAGETSMFDPGGIRTNDDENGIDSGGAGIYEMQPARWRVECTLRNDMNSAQEMEEVANQAADLEETEYIITHISGAVYGCSGKPVGNVRADGKAATLALVLAGGGIMSQV